MKEQGNGKSEVEGYFQARRAIEPGGSGRNNTSLWAVGVDAVVGGFGEEAAVWIVFEGELEHGAVEGFVEFGVRNSEHRR